MFRIFLFFLVLSPAVLIAQPDTSDVFIIGSIPKDSSVVRKDSVVVTSVHISHAFKLDEARLPLPVLVLSFEHILGKSRWALEYEATYDMETDRFWYDYYTAEKFVVVENNSVYTDAHFDSEYMFFIGAGITVKRFLSAKKSGIWGSYFGLRFKDRFGMTDSHNMYDPLHSYPKTIHTGTINLFQVSPTFGHNFLLWDFLLLDVFAGPSAVLSSIKYGTFESSGSTLFWADHHLTQLLPAFDFGFRLGVSFDRPFNLAL